MPDEKPTPDANERTGQTRDWDGMERERISGESSTTSTQRPSSTHFTEPASSTAPATTSSLPRPLPSAWCRWSGTSSKTPRPRAAPLHPVCPCARRPDAEAAEEEKRRVAETIPITGTHRRPSRRAAHSGTCATWVTWVTSTPKGSVMPACPGRTSTHPVAEFPY
jgi:hypothetical protein